MQNNQNKLNHFFIINISKFSYFSINFHSKFVSIHDIIYLDIYVARSASGAFGKVVAGRILRWSRVGGWWRGNGGIPGPESGNGWRIRGGFAAADSGNREWVARETGCGKRESGNWDFRIRGIPEFAESRIRN